MLIHPAFTSILRPQAPVVQLLDLKTDTTSNGANPSTYTFTNCSLGAIGGHAMDEAVLGVQNNAAARNIASRSPSNSYILVVVHTQQSGNAGAVTACRLGGVTGRALVNAAATAAVNSHLFSWPMSALLGITNTDIAVDMLAFTSSVTVAPLLVSNVPGLGTTLVASSASNANGTINLTGGTPSFERVGRNILQISATTTQFTTTTPATFQYLNGRYSGFVDPTFLYNSGNSVHNYACVYSYTRGYMANSAANQLSVVWGDLETQRAFAALLD